MFRRVSMRYGIGLFLYYQMHIFHFSSVLVAGFHDYFRLLISLVVRTIMWIAMETTMMAIPAPVAMIMIL